MSASAIGRAPIIHPTRKPAVDQVRMDRLGIQAQAVRGVKAALARVDSKVASASKAASVVSKVVSINRAASTREARGSTKTNNSKETKASISRAANSKGARAAASRRVARETADHKADLPPAALSNTISKVVSISRADRPNTKVVNTRALNLREERAPTVDPAPDHRADRSPASRESKASLTAKKKKNAATSNLRTSGRSRNESR